MAGVSAPAKSKGKGVYIEVSLYDPRGDLYVDDTNNPILILADIMIKNGFVDTTEKGKFWSQIAYLANYADEKVNGNGNNGNGNGKKSLKERLDEAKKRKKNLV